MVVNIASWVGRIAGSLALILGLLFWIFGIDLIQVHMLLGITVALALLVLSVAMIFTRGLAPMGIAGIVYTLVLPAFGLNQATILVGDAHWVIRATHLIVGLGAIGLMQTMTTRYQTAKSVPAIA